MKIIPSEAWKIASLTKKNLELSDIQKYFIFGTLLGDGTLEKNGRYHRLKVQQSVKQKEYVLWKYGILKNWVVSEPHYQAVNRSLRFRTVSHPILTEFRNKFYKNQIKILPNDLDQYLENPFVIAVWFMDDGNARDHYGYHLNTQSFSFEENQRLAKILNYNFGFDVRVHLNNSKHRLYIGPKNRDSFRSLVKDHIIESLQYKLG